MVGFNRLRRAAKAAPLLGLWLGCVLMTWNATGINNCSIQALAGLGCTNRQLMNVGQALPCFSGEIRCRSFSEHIIALTAIQGHYLIISVKEQLPTDLVQLDVLFQKARGEGINIQCWKFLLILLGNYFSIALVNQYKLSHSWLEDVILPGLAGGNSGFAGEGDPFCPLSSLSIRSHKNGL
ncbi:hypothetical protein NC653_025977 [Populus alba x Populus x berolinensis]|uniref:Uncharacterized protein n=1 Tax=Populus alba x Populus x berolinensis TaxID=444605 RepID=A0AAD6Q8P1_9ROSI|nr:hypothetical protein NC653_025977 [Populus alba x Populus x berolinensis]